jgi:hypothetical protein
VTFVGTPLAPVFGQNLPLAPTVRRRRTERGRTLQVAEMMCIGLFAAANHTGLLGNLAKLVKPADPDRELSSGLDIVRLGQGRGEGDDRALDPCIGRLRHRRAPLSLYPTSPFHFIEVNARLAQWSFRKPP